MSARRKILSAAASEVYLGRTVVGEIVIRRKGEVVALDAAGEAIGTFATEREAMAAILTAARETAR